MKPSDFQVFIDLDGVLADFNAGVTSATGLPPGEQHPHQMWPTLARTPGFYDKLDWMSDGKELWNAIQSFDPVILTGVPMGKWAEGQKRSWCARELGASVPVITGMSRKKAELACAWLEDKKRRGRIPLLVDDSLKLRENWMSSGGTFIHHTSTRESLISLKDLGFPL